MSYRDKSEDIYNVAKKEITYALSVGKTLVPGVETDENEDIVTFNEEGAAYMYEQLDNLKAILPEGFGIAVHHIKDRRSLKS